MTAPNIKEALEQIAADHDCGCVPCKGQCRSQESLQITVDEMRDIARAALATLPPAGEWREAIARMIDPKPFEKDYPPGSTGAGRKEKALAKVEEILILASGLVQDEAGWRDISTAPKDGRMVQLIFEPAEDPGMGFGIYRDGKWIASALFYRMNSGMKPPLEFRELEVTPTHWRPRPEQPAIRSARDGGAET